MNIHPWHDIEIGEKKPKIVNAINKPRENALVINTAFFLSLNATEKNVGSNAIPQGEVIAINPAKNASRNVMLDASCCSYCLSLCNPIGSSCCAKAILDNKNAIVIMNRIFLFIFSSLLILPMIYL